MNLSLKAKNFTLTDSIAAFVQSKADLFDAKVKRFGESVTCEVEVGLTTKHHKKGPIFRAEFHLQLPGKQVYAASEDLNLYTAINSAKKDADAQIAKYKSALDKNKRQAQRSRGGRE